MSLSREVALRFWSRVEAREGLLESFIIVPKEMFRVLDNLTCSVKSRATKERDDKEDFLSIRGVGVGTHRKGENTLGHEVSIFGDFAREFRGLGDFGIARARGFFQNGLLTGAKGYVLIHQTLDELVALTVLFTLLGEGCEEFFEVGWDGSRSVGARADCHDFVYFVVLIVIVTGMGRGSRSGLGPSRGTLDDHGWVGFRSLR